MHKPKILIGSPIKQKSHILKEFLKSLSEIDKEELEVSYLFVDDNDEVKSSQMLNTFSLENKNVIIYKNEEELEQNYFRDDNTHYWNDQLIWKVAKLKNMMIQITKEFNYDYLFLIDSDIVLNPVTIKHLVSLNKEVVSEVFWTKWKPGFPELPQVWLVDEYGMFYKNRNEQLTHEEAIRRENEFVNKMRIPGVYEVGGLGACTLISKSAIEKGVSFDKIKNLSFWGEDRHFCVRAAAIGIELFVDTHYPAYHIYRDEDLGGIVKFKQQARKADIANVQIQAKEIVRLGMKALGTYHYDRGYSLPWENYFSIDMRKQLNIEIESQQALHATAHTKVNAFVENLEYASYDEKTNKHHIKFTLHNYILQKGERSESHLTCYCEVMEEAKNYKIMSFEVVGEYKVAASYNEHKKPEKLTLSMIIKNEAGRFLEEVLQEHSNYIDSAVIIDDGSTDQSIEICKKVLSNVKLVIIENPISKFSNEVTLRKQQWQATLEEEPDWILNLDADEIFEKKFSKEIHFLIHQKDFSTISFPLYDMWDKEHYRDDEYWFAHKTQRPFLIKYDGNYDYEWLEAKQHCGRFPKNILDIGSNAVSSLRLKHLGWSRHEERIDKYNRYQMLDTEKNDFTTKHYASILDEKPNLLLWQE